MLWVSHLLSCLQRAALSKVEQQREPRP
jgi:hypothetical protein